MKYLAILALLAAAPSAYALDTSGCTPMRAQAVVAATPGNNSLRATLSRAPFAGCWNANESSLQLQYNFAAAAGTPRVAMYTKVNGVEKTVDATVQCGLQSGINYGKDTSNDTLQSCAAYAVVPAPADGAVSAEVAVVVNGVWDTGGGVNTQFNF